MKEASFWDQVAGVYDLFARFLNQKVHKELRYIIEKRITGTDEVLECACGTGMLSEVIAPKCKHIIATNISKNMLKRAANKCVAYGNAEFREGNVASIIFPDHCFDKVVAANVIHLLDNPLKALNELYRVCRPGGQIIIPTYINKQSNKVSCFAKLAGKAGAGFRQQFTFDTYQTFFQEASYKNMEYMFIQGRIPCAVAIINK